MDKDFISKLAAGLTHREPVESVDRGHFIGSLDRCRVDKEPPRAKLGVAEDAQAHDPDCRGDFEKRWRRELGREELSRREAYWQRRRRADFRRFSWVIEQLEMARREGVQIRNPGAYAEKLWRRGDPAGPKGGVSSHS